MAARRREMNYSTNSLPPAVVAAAVTVRDAFFDVDLAGTPVRVYVASAGEGAALQVGRSLIEVEQALRQLVLTLAVISVVTVGLAAVIGRLVAATAVAPVHRVAEAADTVARTGDLSQHLAVPGGDDLGHSSDACPRGSLGCGRRVPHRTMAISRRGTAVSYLAFEAKQPSRPMLAGDAGAVTSTKHLQGAAPTPRSTPGLPYRAGMSSPAAPAAASSVRGVRRRLLHPLWTDLLTATAIRVAIAVTAPRAALEGGLDRMKAFRRSGRRRWLLTVGCLAATLPLCLSASAMPAVGRPEGRQSAPVVNPDYLYNQLYAMAKAFSYRISGADGDPHNAADPFNLPPTVNGWHELVAYWTGQLTHRRVNTQLAGFATVMDHYFRRAGGYRFDSDDVEVTIPGASCAGQRVLLAAHPDETPVPTDIVGLINSGTTSGTTGFGAARRHVTDSNLGNEGAYDGLSGVALTMAEYRALLEWYHANGTYPKRTLKVTLLDASRGKTGNGLFSREGSAYYAANLIPSGPQGRYVLFANMDALGLDYPAYHLGTEFFWNNVTGGGVGPWFTFIKATPTAPNLAYPDTGAGSPGANITANAPAIGQLRADLRAAVIAGFSQQGVKYNFTVPLENPLRYNQPGQAPNPYGGVVPTKPAYLPGDQDRFSPVRDDTDALEDEQAFFNQGVPGFTVSGVKNSNADENPYAASVSDAVKATPVVGYAGNQTTFQLGNNTPQPGMTTTAVATAPGDTTVKVAAVTNLAPGQPVFIGTGADIEYGQIQSIGTAGPDGTGVTLTAPLARAHPGGVPFTVNENQPVGYLSDTIEHLNYFAGGAPHGRQPQQPTEGLKRALELPAQWTSLLLAGDGYLGAVARPDKPVAYFETTPAKPDMTLTVTFDAGFSRDARGRAGGLKYYWDLGDGTHATGARVTHTYRSAIYADVKLAVGKGRDWGLYRQAVAVDGPAGAAPQTNPCGTFTPDESARLISAARKGTDQ